MEHTGNDVIFDDIRDFKTETGYPTDSAFNVGIDEQERTVPDTPPAQTVGLTRF